MSLKQPVTQVRLTNVAVVRLKVHGRRYEVACYKNKVVSWRSGVETDLDEVLQSRHIFLNVSKGVMAGEGGLSEDFGTRDEEVVAKLILDKGEIQVSEKERAHALESLQRDICVLVSEMCVNPQTHRPYPVRMIEQGMRDCHFSIQTTKSAKSQALALIKQLQPVMPIDRAHMRVTVTCDQSIGKQLKKQLQPLLAGVEEEQWGSVEYRLTALLSPGQYRQVEEVIAQHSSRRAHMEIVDLKVHEETERKELEEDEEEEGEEEDGAPSALKSSSSSINSAASSLSSLHLSSATAPSTSSSAAPSKAAPPPPKSKKAQRRELDEEEIRTVGERREWEEEQGEVEDSARLRQLQQAANARAKKERKQKKAQQTGKANYKEGSDGEEEAQESRKDEEEAEAGGKAGKGGKGKAVSQAKAEGEDDGWDDGRAKKGKKTGRRKKKTGGEAAVTAAGAEDTQSD